MVHSTGFRVVRISVAGTRAGFSIGTTSSAVKVMLPTAPSVRSLAVLMNLTVCRSVGLIEGPEVAGCPMAEHAIGMRRTATEAILDIPQRAGEGAVKGNMISDREQAGGTAWQQAVGEQNCFVLGRAR